MKNKIRHLALFSLLLLMAAYWFGAPAQADEIPDEVDLKLFSGSQWTFSPGGEYPGAAGSFETGSIDGKDAGTLNYDFTGGGAYVQAWAPVAIPAAYTEIRFRAKAGHEMNFGLRLIDSSGQTHQYDALPYTQAGDWQLFRIEFKDPASSHFQGADDGVMHFPFIRMAFTVNKGETATGAINFADVEMLN